MVGFLIGQNKGYFNSKKLEFDRDINFEEVEIESVGKDELEKLLQNALSQQNHKVAIRAIYLLTIWHLDDKNIIALQENKTNFDYQYEIKNASTRADFESITRVYDYIWYGEFEAEQIHFEQAESFYKNLTKKL